MTITTTSIALLAACPIIEQNAAIASYRALHYRQTRIVLLCASCTNIAIARLGDSKMLYFRIWMKAGNLLGWSFCSMFPLRRLWSSTALSGGSLRSLLASGWLPRHCRPSRLGKRIRNPHNSLASWISARTLCRKIWKLVRTGPIKIKDWRLGST